MIPGLILVGLVLGRWWRTTLAIVATAWPAWLVVGGVMGPESGLVGAGALAVVNAGVGVAVHQGILRLIRLARGEDTPCGGG